MNSVMFSKKMMQAVAQKALKLKPGAIVITYDGLPGHGLEPVSNIQVKTSWSEATEYEIQKVAKHGGGSVRGVNLLGVSSRRGHHKHTHHILNTGPVSSQENVCSL